MTTSLLTERARAAPAAAAGIAITIRGLTKRFPRRRSWKDTLHHPLRSDTATALHRIECDVRRGEFFGLLGPNGAGKTTLFKILATLILPDAGSAQVEGCDVARNPAGVRRVLTPVIADERSLHWRLSAYENLRLFAVLHGVSAEALHRRVVDLLHAVGLRDERSKLVGTFSSGMKQRLLIARALIATPKVLLLDEPTRSLDPVTARDFHVFLREEIAGRRGCTVLLATHNTEEALQLCDRVAVLDHGRLIATGAPAALKERFGDERYRVWTREAAWAVSAILAEQGLACHCPAAATGPDGWSVVEVDIPGGPERVAAVLQILIARGVAVARCERVELSLAELLERVLHGA